MSTRRCRNRTLSAVGYSDGGVLDVLREHAASVASGFVARGGGTGLGGDSRSTWLADGRTDRGEEIGIPSDSINLEVHFA